MLTLVRHGFAVDVTPGPHEQAAAQVDVTWTTSVLTETVAVGAADSGLPAGLTAGGVLLQQLTRRTVASPGRSSIPTVERHHRELQLLVRIFCQLLWITKRFVGNEPM